MRKFSTLLAIPLLFPLAVRAAEVVPDITVAADGSGQFTTIQKAMESIPKENRDRVVVYVKDGTYKEKVRVDASFVTLRGQSREGTHIAFSQVYGDWQKSRDDLGRAVVNVVGSDFVLQNMTVENTSGVPNHSFVLYTETADRIVITDANIISQGGDTLAPMKAQNAEAGTGGGGRYYLARLNIRGAVDFVCPKGWCYLEDSTLYETRPDASVWHDGSGAKDQKFVLRRCTFTGVDNFRLGRHHVAANFYFLDCTFAKNMANTAPYLVRYPTTSPQNAINDKRNPWGDRIYFFDCHREGGGDFTWMKDNLETAEGPPKTDQITPTWTFGNTWDPTTTKAPTIKSIATQDQQISVTFSEPVTVKGQPKLVLVNGAASYASGSGTATLLFNGFSSATVKALDLANGAILATEGGSTTRFADLTLPSP